MERLTIRTNEASISFECESVGDIVRRLAAIEDILGDEYDLDEMREMVQAKREGRCVVLPCEAGREILYKSCIGLWCNAVIDEYTPENIFIVTKTDIPNAEPLHQVFSLSEIEAALRREQDEKVGGSE